MHSDITRAATRAMPREEAPARDRKLLIAGGAFARREVVNVANFGSIKDANKLNTLDTVREGAQKLSFIHFRIGGQFHDFCLRHC